MSDQRKPIDREQGTKPPSTHKEGRGERRRWIVLTDFHHQIKVSFLFVRAGRSIASGDFVDLPRGAIWDVDADLDMLSRGQSQNLVWLIQLESIDGGVV